MKDNSDLLTYDEVAQRLKVTRRHVTTLVASGDIPVIRFGKRCVRFDPADVDAYIEKAKGSRRSRAGS